MVVTSPITFTAPTNGVEQCGARPEFIDVKPDTLLLAAAALETFLAVPKLQGIDPNAHKAILPVHFAGPALRY
jgi:dTDP-4-amino-4,6-dideoxygalactose transaminase